MIGQLIEEATLSGARLEAAVDAVGLSIRTLQRWNLQDVGSDRRRGPGKRAIFSESCDSILFPQRSGDFLYTKLYTKIR